MFKKFILALLMIGFLASQVIASEINETLISATLLDDSPTSATAATNVQNFKKIGFWVSYDETQVGASVSLTVAITVSYDGTNYVTGSFYDVAGGATAQTSETISGDGWYFFWLDANWPYKYVTVTLTGNNTDADDTASVACYIVGMK